MESFQKNSMYQQVNVESAKKKPKKNENFNATYRNSQSRLKEKAFDYQLGGRGVLLVLGC